MPIADTLTTRTTRAASWRLTGAVVGALSQFVVGVVLARLLTPADFGVATIALSIVQIVAAIVESLFHDVIVHRAGLTQRGRRGDVRTGVHRLTDIQPGRDDPTGD